MCSSGNSCHHFWSSTIFQDDLEVRPWFGCILQDEVNAISTDIQCNLVISSSVLRLATPLLTFHLVCNPGISLSPICDAEPIFLTLAPDRRKAPANSYPRHPSTLPQTTFISHERGQGPECESRKWGVRFPLLTSPSRNIRCSRLVNLLLWGAGFRRQSSQVVKESRHGGR